MFVRTSKRPRISNAVCIFSKVYLLQYDLNGLLSWSYDWDLNFNPSKCNVLKISRKRNSAFRNYTIEANALSETNSVKDLGVVISSTLSWRSHVISTVAKCNKILGFLRRNTPNSLGIDLRRALYLSLVRSTLCYGSQVWAPQSSTRDLLLLERVQRRASKYILAPGGACFADLSYREVDKTWLDSCFLLVWISRFGLFL